MVNPKCKLVEQGFKKGSCDVYYQEKGTSSPEYLKDWACQVTLKGEGATPSRTIRSAFLSRPEDYLSIYQSGCNFSCLNCHSWEFSQYKGGHWMSPGDILKLALEYDQLVTVKEPRERATSSHAQELCRHCGRCVLTGERSSRCPQKLEPEQILFSPQGYGPARNILAFTGGDLTCRPEWYCQSSAKIKEAGLDLWVLIETNGYGLTPDNLDLYKGAGVDSFWLDIKAFDKETHKKLTGAENQHLLKLPEEIIKRDFTLEVLTLFIPGWVEAEEIKKIARLLAGVNKDTYFTILAFFGEHKLKDVPSPSLEQMVEAYQVSREAGLKNVRLGNLGVFIKGQEDYEYLLKYAKDAL